MSYLTYFFLCDKILCQMRGEIDMNSIYNNEYFDYYNNTSSYVKIILDLIPSELISTEKKDIIKEIYNYILNNLNDLKKAEVICVSSMFREKIGNVNEEEIMKQAAFMYNNFIVKMLYDSINRDRIFDIMNECVKLYSGYYTEGEFIISSINGIKKEKCCYR